MKTYRSLISLFITVIFLGLNAGYANESGSVGPPISVAQAISLAKDYVKNHKIDVSKSYIGSATMNLNPRGDREPFWLITWEPNAGYSSFIKTAGGQVLLSIYMDRKIEVRYGE